MESWVQVNLVWKRECFVYYWFALTGICKCSHKSGCAPVPATWGWIILFVILFSISKRFFSHTLFLRIPWSLFFLLVLSGSISLNSVCVSLSESTLANIRLFYYRTLSNGQKLFYLGIMDFVVFLVYQEKILQSVFNEWIGCLTEVLVGF